MDARLVSARSWEEFLRTGSHEDVLMTIAEDGLTAESIAQSLAYLLARIDVLERALQTYGYHKESCDSEHGCTCGFRAALQPSEEAQ